MDFETTVDCVRQGIYFSRCHQAGEILQSRKQRILNAWHIPSDCVRSSHIYPQSCQVSQDENGSGSGERRVVSGCIAC